jgi:glycosyltransferase involved in cell wall biosynthesis
MAQRLQIDVRLVGVLEPTQLVGAYNAATCVVHPGPEAFSLALIEALACGRPVLATDSGGTKELLGTAGVLAPPGEPRSFAALLQGLLQDAKLRDALGTAARRRAVDRFTLERMVQSYAHVVESLG